MRYKLKTALFSSILIHVPVWVGQGRIPEQVILPYLVLIYLGY